MMADEKERLLAFFERESIWCRDGEAQDAAGDPVRYDDDAAVAWDITGALCRLFGWQRACVLFGQFDRHIHGKRVAFGWPQRNTDVDAMVALQEFNDRAETTFAHLRGAIESMPVWHGSGRGQATAQQS
jgi:hypothetical protein